MKGTDEFLDLKEGLAVSVPFITVEGPIGVGKTSLSRRFQKFGIIY